MKIYLLILMLAVLCQFKYRHIRNLTIEQASPSRVKWVTSFEIVYEEGSKIVTFNMSNLAKLQIITIPLNSKFQVLSSQPMILYLNESYLYQTHSNARNYNYSFLISGPSWMSQMSSFEHSLAIPIYSETNSPNELKIFGPNPWDVKSITWSRFNKGEMIGGSSVNYKSENAFYFAAGGICSSVEKNINLYGVKNGVLSIAYKIPIQNCDPNNLNTNWKLNSKFTMNESYHLITYSTRFGQTKYISYLVSETNGIFQSKYKLETNQVLGLQMNENIILRTEKKSCRIIQYNMNNREIYRYNQTAFKQKKINNINIQTRQNYVVYIGQIPEKPFRYYAFRQKILDNFTFSGWKLYDTGSTNAVKAYLTYYALNLFDDSIPAKSYIYYEKIYQQFQNMSNDNSKGQQKKYLFDMCQGGQNFLYYLNNQFNVDPYLTLVTINDHQIIYEGGNVIMQNYTQITCLDSNNILLSAKNISSFQIWQSHRYFEFRSRKIRQPLSDATFTYCKDVLIFVNSQSNQATFYDYDFNLLPLSFNLPPNSYFKIIQSRLGGIILAVGSAKGKYDFLDYYVYQDKSFAYKGSFPYYYDGGEADLSKILLFTLRGAIHIEYSQGNNQWYAIFDLKSPPLWIYRSYLGEQEKDCSGYSQTLFFLGDEDTKMITLNKKANLLYELEKYSLKDGLMKKDQSYQFKIFKELSISRASSNDQIILKGETVEGSFYSEIRNIHMLQLSTYSKKQSQPSNQTIINGIQKFKQMIAFSYLRNQNTNEEVKVIFQSNIQRSVPLKNDLLSSIKLFCVCPNCTFVAFTGNQKLQTDSKMIIVEDIQNPYNFKSIPSECQPQSLALSPGAGLIAWTCSSTKIYVYDISSKSLVLNKTVEKQILQLTFLNDSSLRYLADGKIQSIIIGKKREKIQFAQTFNNISAFSVNYDKNVYAAFSNSSVQIYDMSNNLVETISTKNSESIISLDFSKDGELLVAYKNNVVIFSEQPCPINSAIDNNNFCSCDSGFVLDSSQNCQGCSVMCKTCYSESAFDCNNYSAVFFIFVFGISVVSLLLLAVLYFKVIKKKTKNQESLLQNQGSNIVSEVVGNKDEQN